MRKSALKRSAQMRQEGALPWDIVNRRNRKIETTPGASFAEFKIRIWENFIALTEGRGNIEHAQYVAQSINVACDLAQLRRLGRKWRPELLSAFEAHKTMCERSAESGGDIYADAEKELVRVAVDVHIEQLDNCTAIELKNSVDRLLARKSSGHFVEVRRAAA